MVQRPHMLGAPPRPTNRTGVREGLGSSGALHKDEQIYYFTVTVVGGGYTPNPSETMLMVQKSETTTGWMYKILHKSCDFNYQPQLVVKISAINSIALYSFIHGEPYTGLT